MIMKLKYLIVIFCFMDEQLFFISHKHIIITGSKHNIIKTLLVAVLESLYLLGGGILAPFNSFFCTNNVNRCPSMLHQIGLTLFF